jgi:hypothetical protein
MEWTSIVENLVDLEGIANDGLGYTVSITGPDRPSPKGRKWLRVPRMNLLHPRESSRRAPPVTTRGLAIPLKTEVVINESWRSTTTAGRGSRHGSANDIPATDMTIDAAIGHIFPEYLGDSSMLTPEPAEDPTPQKVADSSGRGSNGSISMSPAKPGSGNRVNNQGTVR